MNISKGKAVEKLRSLAERGQNLGAGGMGDPTFKKWKNDCQAALRNIFGVDSAQLKQFDRTRFTPTALSLHGDNSAAFASSFRGGMTSALKQIEAYADEVSDFWPEEQVTLLRDT